MNRHRGDNFYIVIKDIATILCLRMKLIIKDKTTLTALITSVLIFSVVIHSLTVSSDTQSAIPVGMVDYDHSMESKKLLERVSKVPAIRVVQSDEKDLHKKLLDEMIQAVFIIEEGYEARLMKGDLNEIITMHYLWSNKSVSILSDIFAGEMIYPISLYKSIKLYDGLQFEGTKYTQDEYIAYVQKLLAESGYFDFAFRMVYANPGSNHTNQEPISNSLLYNQLVFGILGVLISFIAMFILSGVVWEKEIGILDRLRTSKLSALKIDVGNIGALLVVEGLIALLFALLIFTRLDTWDFRIFLSAYLLILFYAAVMGGVFTLIGKIVKSIILYQMLCSVLILITGGLGFYHLLSGFYQIISMSFLKIIPNSWFIQGFTDIILYANEGGLLSEAHHMLVRLAAVIALFVLIYNLFGYKIRNKIQKK